MQLTRLPAALRRSPPAFAPAQPTTKPLTPFNGMPQRSLISGIGSRSLQLAPCNSSSGSPNQTANHMYHTTDAPITNFGFATDFLDHFDIKDTLGHGTFGTVFVAQRKSDGERFAVKRMPKRFGPGGTLDKYYVRRVRNEVEIGSHLGASLNIAYLYGAYEDDQRVDIVFELCSGGELWGRIRSDGAYTERNAARLVREVLRTVAQCHAAGVLMRDIKPENFLFANKDADAPLKAIDFGISVFCEPGEIVELRAGTPVYIAPEVLKQRYSLPADLWSVGIVAYQLLTGRLPFGGEHAEVAEHYMRTGTADNKEVFRAVLYAEMDYESHPWDILSPQAKDLVSSLLQRDPDARPTAQEALQHPWLAEGGDPSTPTDVPLADTIVQRLQRFGTYGRLKQAALRQVAHAALMARSSGTDTSTTPTSTMKDSNLPEALKNVFASLDPQGTGRASVDALRTELSDGHHFRLSQVEVDQMCAQLSSASSSDKGEVEWEAWVAAMSDWRLVRKNNVDWDSFVREAFASMDRDADALLGLDDLEAALCGEEGCEVEDEASAALREADSDGDGALSLEEFKELLMAHDGDLNLFDARLSRSSSSSASFSDVDLGATIDGSKNAEK